MSKFDTPLNILDAKVYLAWFAKIQSYDLQNGDSAIKNMVSALYHGEHCFIVKRFSGSYKFCFQNRFQGRKEDMLLRFPIHGAVMNPWKKVEDEALVMRFIKEKTSIPIPNYYTHGVASAEFDGLGPFILMEFIPGQRLDELLSSGDEFKSTVTEAQLNKVYEQIATIYTQLWGLEFDRIGRLSPDPLTIKQNELECHGIKVPEMQTPPDASVYMRELINQSILGLRDKSCTIANEEQCREEYLSLLSLQAIAPQMVKAEFLKGPFKLYNPDIRLGNMIAVADYEIKAVIDWDFGYVAPAQFLYGPPLGLTLLDMLECSDDDLEAFKAGFNKFIRVLREKDATLSGLMEECMDNGTFWYNQAVQESKFWQSMLKRLWTFRPAPTVQDPPDNYSGWPQVSY
ncbi:hypothetical protein IFR05_010259 [Cadophora sp. M221]|nr:hypothetical protein IFR05_010259 [Cadophora sp. M221]